MFTFEDYILNLENIDLDKILKDWTWLIGKDKTIIAITKMGDMVLKCNENMLYFLDTGVGVLKEVSDNFEDFLGDNLEDEVYEELLLLDLIDELEEDDRVLKPNQVFSYYKLPVLGGTYDLKNIRNLNIYEHFKNASEVNQQVKDQYDAENVKFQVIEPKEKKMD